MQIRSRLAGGWRGQSLLCTELIPEIERKERVLWKTLFGGRNGRVPEGELTKLQDSLREMESRVKAVEMEWALTYKKIARLTGHLTKSAAIDRTPPDPEEQKAPEPELTRDEIARM